MMLLFPFHCLLTLVCPHLFLQLECLVLLVFSELATKTAIKMWRIVLILCQNNVWKWIDWWKTTQGYGSLSNLLSHKASSKWLVAWSTAHRNLTRFMKANFSLQVRCPPLGFQPALGFMQGGSCAGGACHHWKENFPK